MPTIREKILAAAAQPHGTRAGELPGVTANSMHTQISVLVAAGKIHRLQVAPRNVRFFTDVDAMNAYVYDPSVLRALEKRSAPILGAPATAKPSNGLKPLRVAAPWGKDAKVTVPEHVKVQYGPSHPPKFKEIEFSFVHGGLRCA